MSHPLQEVFLATTYRVCLDGQWTATRIGVPSEALADWLRGQDHARASLLSACNPRGALQPAEINAARDEALRRQLAGKGWSFSPAEGVSADGRWRESSLFVPGLHGPECRSLMQAFDQLAWVEYDAAGQAQLRWTRDLDPGT